MARTAARLRGPGVVLGAALLAAACASSPDRLTPVLAPVAPRETPELIRRWEVAWQQFIGLIAAVEVTIRSSERTDRSAAVLLLGPRALRVEVATPLGFPGLVAIAGPERLTVFRPLDREMAIGPVTPESIGRWIGLPVPLPVLLRVLAGQVPTPPPDTPVRIEDRDGPHLAWDDGGLVYRVWITPERTPGRLVVDGPEPLTATFIRTITGEVQTLTLEAPQRRAAFILAFRSVEPASPEPGAFELAVPPGVTVVRTD